MRYNLNLKFFSTNLITYDYSGIRVIWIVPYYFSCLSHFVISWIILINSLTLSMNTFSRRKGKSIVPRDIDKRTDCKLGDTCLTISCVAPVCGNRIANCIDRKRSNTAKCNLISRQLDAELVSHQFNWSRYYALSSPVRWYDTPNGWVWMYEIERAREKLFDGSQIDLIDKRMFYFCQYSPRFRLWLTP